METPAALGNPSTEANPKNYMLLGATFMRPYSERLHRRKTGSGGAKLTSL